MQLKVVLIFLVLPLVLVLTAEEHLETTEEYDPYAQPDEEEESPCDVDEEFVDGKCIDSCITRQVCGNFTVCESAGSRVTCSCLKGYTGSPIDGCFKMNEQSPCDPDPCGPNSKCIIEDEINGPHCECLDDFYDWPPHCRAGCKTHTDCPGASEVCDQHHYCKDVCDPSPCGDHAVCRLDKVKSNVHCACEEGYVPQKGIGCRLKSADDLDVPLELISEVVSDPCGKKCGFNSYCDVSTGSCVCTQGYVGNTSIACNKVEDPERVDACSPNPCGGYSQCVIEGGEKSCSCVEGYGTPPYCSACYAARDCGDGMICINGRCLLNVCEEYCGRRASCNVFNGLLECSCGASARKITNRPYEECSTVSHIPPALIGTLLG